MKKLRVILIISILFVIVKSNSQTLVGIWQKDTSEVNSAYTDTYQFFSDSSFKFNVSQYDYLNRIRSICGKYKVINDSIYFTIEYTIEILGGNIERSHITSINDSWEIENGKIEKIPVSAIITEVALFSTQKIDTGIILIDLFKYYKVDSNPNNF